MCPAPPLLDRLEQQYTQRASDWQHLSNYARTSTSCSARNAYMADASDATLQLSPETASC